MNVCDLINQKLSETELSTILGIDITGSDDVQVHSTGNDSKEDPEFCEWSSKSLVEAAIARTVNQNQVEAIFADNCSNATILPDPNLGTRSCLTQGGVSGDSRLSVIDNGVEVTFIADIGSEVLPPPIPQSDLTNDTARVEALYTAAVH